MKEGVWIMNKREIYDEKKKDFFRELYKYVIIGGVIVCGLLCVRGVLAQQNYTDMFIASVLSVLPMLGLSYCAFKMIDNSIILFPKYYRELSVLHITKSKITKRVKVKKKSVKLWEVSIGVQGIIRNKLQPYFDRIYALVNHPTVDKNILSSYIPYFDTVNAEIEYALRMSKSKMEEKKLLGNLDYMCLLLEKISLSLEKDISETVEQQQKIPAVINDMEEFYSSEPESFFMVSKELSNLIDINFVEPVSTDYDKAGKELLGSLSAL